MKATEIFIESNSVQPYTIRGNDVYYWYKHAWHLSARKIFEHTTLPIEPVAKWILKYKK